MKNRNFPKRAFTLIEVLIVIGIIGVLISLLMPALSAARERGRQAVCVNNLRSIWTGILAYSMVYDDRVPYMEDINLDQPNADPFSPDYPTTVGTILNSYVTAGSWRCPSAIAGFPANLGAGGWKLTYKFTAAGSAGDTFPYDDAPGAYTQNISINPVDPALQNYNIFDGRPMKLLDGRRYVAPPGGVNQNRKGRWTTRFPIISDAFVVRDNPYMFSPLYPHKARPKARLDLGNARTQFERDTNSSRAGGKGTGYHELHADQEDVEILFTRNWQAHPPGY